jgi:hypothetical protein
MGFDHRCFYVAPLWGSVRPPACRAVPFSVSGIVKRDDNPFRARHLFNPARRRAQGERMNRRDLLMN